MQLVPRECRDEFSPGSTIVFYTHIVKQQIQSADKGTVVLSYRNSSWWPTTEPEMKKRNEERYLIFVFAYFSILYDQNNPHWVISQEANLCIWVVDFRNRNL